MANVLDLRRRIRSVKNTRQITKAMKMVAAAKLRRAQDRMTHARPYAVALASVLASLRRRVEFGGATAEFTQSPLLAVRPEKNVLLLVVSGDKGFAGAFSSNIVRAASQFITTQQQLDRNKRLDVEAVGRKGRDFFRRRFLQASFGEKPIAAVGEAQQPAPRTRRDDVEYIGVESSGNILMDKLSFESVRLWSEEVVDRYITADVDAVYFAYNQFQSVISQRVVVERLLPLVSEKDGSLKQPDVAASVEPTAEEKEKAAQAALTAGVSLRDEEQEAIRAQYEDESKRFGTAEVDYSYDQPAEEVYAALLPRYVSAMLYYAMLESSASEQAARMTAMDAASNNASEMIDSLTLTMNRVRQAAITKEIIEIVSGASAV